MCYRNARLYAPFKFKSMICSLFSVKSVLEDFKIWIFVNLCAFIRKPASLAWFTALFLFLFKISIIFYCLLVFRMNECVHFVYSILFWKTWQARSKWMIILICLFFFLQNFFWHARLCVEQYTSWQKLIVSSPDVNNSSP